MEKTKTKDRISLSDHFTLARLLRFTMPSIIMLILSSVYTIVDGLFVANFVSSDALAAINIVMPLFLVLGAFGFMLGTGGSAEVAKAMGEERDEDANSYFTTLTAAIAVLGTVLNIAAVLFMRPLCYLLGSSDRLIEDCVVYGVIILIGNIPYMLQVFFQAFFITAEKPKLGMILTILSGITNMVLDYVFIVVFQWGITGAAAATSVGCVVGGILPLFYFARPNTSRLRFVKLRLHHRMLGRSTVNGSSEMVSNISRAVSTFLFNIQLMRLVGEDGVSAISIMEYFNFVFIAALIGFATGSAPVIGFHYGAQNHRELKGLFRHCMSVTIVSSLSIFALSQLFAPALVYIFVSDSATLYDLTLHGFRIFAFSFLAIGVNIFASTLFTALCNGLVSAFISAMRTLVLEVAAILILPIFLDTDGVWLALPVAEALALLIAVACIVFFRKRYHYA